MLLHDLERSNDEEKQSHQGDYEHNPELTGYLHCMRLSKYTGGVLVGHIEEGKDGHDDAERQ